MEEGSSSMERDDPAYEGQREYTPLFLRIDDPLVAASSRQSCGAARRLAWWRGTGATSATGTSTSVPVPATSWNEPACLTAALSPSSTPTCTSSIIIPAVASPGHHGHRGRRLQATSRPRAVRLRRARWRAPLPAGTAPRKAAAVANVAAVLAPTGVLFGASILGSSGRHTWLSRRLLEANNRRGTFDNLGDTQEGLGEILEASFERVELETVGSMAIFAATNPRTKPSTGMTP